MPPAHYHAPALHLPAQPGYLGTIPLGSHVTTRFRVVPRLSGSRRFSTRYRVPSLPYVGKYLSRCSSITAASQFRRSSLQLEHITTHSRKTLLHSSWKHQSGRRFSLSGVSFVFCPPHVSRSAASYSARMGGTSGVWHKTSVQQAQETNTAYSIGAVSGQKRSRSELDQHSSARTSSSGNGPPKRTVSLPTGPSRLSASSIIPLDLGLNPVRSEYSHRQAIQATPSASIDPLLSLAHAVYDLPPSLILNFLSLGIKSIYPWQKACLLGPGLLSGEKNLVYSAPTGGGKSLVADGKCKSSAMGDQRSLLLQS